MPICPNKSLPAWTNLIEGLKKTFAAEGKELSDKDLNDYAEIAFHRYGDIPDAQVAYKYISNKVNKEEIQFDKWANYTKGQFITNQGELSFEDFKVKFDERFGATSDEIEVKKVYEEGKTRYNLNKAFDQLASNTVAQRQKAEGKTPWYTDIIPAFKNYFIANFSKLGEISQASKDAAMKYLSSATQTSMILKGAVSKISQEHGPKAWSELRQALVQSRLDGIRNRWMDMSKKVMQMSDVELIDNLSNGIYTKLLSEIEGRTPLTNLSQDVSNLIMGDHFDDARELISSAFEKASENVAKVDFSGGRSYEEITKDENIKNALNLYKSTVEKPIADNHAANEGFMSNDLGELNTYFPLIPLDEKGGFFSSKLGFSKLSPIKNKSNNFATGLSNAYDLSVNNLSKRITDSFKANNKTAFFKSLSDAGVIKELNQSETASDVIVINGTSYPARSEAIGTAMLVNGKMVPPKRILMPEWLYKELKPIIQEGDMDRNMFQKALNGVTTLALKGIVEPTIHTANLVGAIVNGTPFPGTNWVSKSIGNTPVTKVISSIFNICNEDVTSEAAIKHLQEMANIGLLSPKSGAVTWFKKISESTGAKKESLLNLSPVLYGRKGIDLKARVLMDRICLEINPKATPEERRQFNYQLGNYLKGAEGQLERTLKKNGLAPFFTASSTFLKNGIKGWVGATSLPTSGMTLGRKIQMRAAQQLSGGAVGLLSTWVLAYKVNTGNYPWEDKNSNFLKIPLNDKEKELAEKSPAMKKLLFKNGKWEDVNLGFFNKTLERGGKALGLNAIYDTYMQGGTGGQMAEAASKDEINSFLTPMVSSPGIHLLSTAVLGEAPYITSLRDYNTGKFNPQFQQTVRTMESFPKQVGANFAQGIMNTNSILSNIGDFSGFSFKPKYGSQDDMDFMTSFLRGSIDISLPNLFKPHIDNEKKAMQLKKSEKKVEREAGKESGEKKPSSGSMKSGGMKGKSMRGSRLGG